ncbi:unnamed protein product [Rhodiola kirilowii]
MTVATYLSRLLRNHRLPSASIYAAKQAHAQLLINGLLSHATLQTDLLLLYSKCSLPLHVRQVFDQMLHPNMHSWNILFASYLRNSLYDDALTTFSHFLKQGLLPDHFTLPQLFKACAGLSLINLGRSLQGWVICLGFEDYLVVGNSVLDFYMKCGNSFDAWRIFRSMSCKDTAVWNSMISGLGRAGLFMDALICFRNMLEEGVNTDCMTMPAILSACGHDGQLMQGKEIHGQIIKCWKYQDDIAIGNSLIDMYSKCGCLNHSEKVFANMSELNIVSWTTMMSCYGSHGKGHGSLKIFKNMKDVGFKPNCVTLTALLASCSHAGLINEGRNVFHSIICKYRFEHRVEHFTCMVDLLGRCGHIEEAFQLIKDKVSMASAWGALLAGCMMHKNIEIGKIAAHHLFELEPKNSSNYIALCTIYKSLSMQKEYSETRAKMRELRLAKSPGCSWINIAGEIHKFYQGDVSHPLADMIYEVIDGMTATLMMPRNDD